MEKNEIKKMCPPRGYYPPFKKKDSWFVFLCNREGKIYDIEIYCRYREDANQFQRITENVRNRLNNSYFDSGNCCSTWDKSSISDILLHFFYDYEFESKDAKIKCLKCIGCIEEFKEQIDRFLNYLGHESQRWG